FRHARSFRIAWPGGGSVRGERFHFLAGADLDEPQSTSRLGVDGVLAVGRQGNQGRAGQTGELASRLVGAGVPDAGAALLVGREPRLAVVRHVRSGERNAIRVEPALGGIAGDIEDVEDAVAPRRAKRFAAVDPANRTDPRRAFGREGTSSYSLHWVP